MTDQPISLTPAEPEVNHELVRFLEHMLAEAKAGRVLSLACSGEKTGREVFSMFSGDFDVFRMLDSLELLKSRPGTWNRADPRFDIDLRR